MQARNGRTGEHEPVAANANEDGAPHAEGASERPWALVLAGGEGRRLQALTRMIAGEPIPKQYCRIVGDRSLLEATLARIGPLVPPERTQTLRMEPLWRRRSPARLAPSRDRSAACAGE